LECLRSGAQFKDYPYVLEYIPQFDHGGIQRRKHLGWDETGWLALWEYPHGGILGWSGEYEVVTGEQVAKWGRELGGWERQ
jgi:hypothetical protein